MCMQNQAFVPTHTFRMKSTESFINESPDTFWGHCIVKIYIGHGCLFSMIWGQRRWYKATAGWPCLHVCDHLCAQRQRPQLGGTLLGRQHSLEDEFVRAKAAVEVRRRSYNSHTHMLTQENHRYLFIWKVWKKSDLLPHKTSFLRAYSQCIWPPGNSSFVLSVRSVSPCKLRLHNWCIFSLGVQHQHKWLLKEVALWWFQLLHSSLLSRDAYWAVIFIRHPFWSDVLLSKETSKKKCQSFCTVAILNNDTKIWSISWFKLSEVFSFPFILP